MCLAEQLTNRMVEFQTDLFYFQILLKDLFEELQLFFNFLPGFISKHQTQTSNDSLSSSLNLGRLLRSPKRKSRTSTDAFDAPCWRRISGTTKRSRPGYLGQQGSKK